MIISGFDKLSLVNYPKVVACTVFTNGCMWRCAFCQNSTLATGDDPNRIPEEKVLDYLRKRKGLVDGICISGGEPTMQADLPEFAKKCKEIGMKVKLDTNGTNPQMVQKMLEDESLDYIAMDVKMPFKQYSQIVRAPAFEGMLQETIRIIKKYGKGVKVKGEAPYNESGGGDRKKDGHIYKIDYEFRTTIMKEFHDKKTILEILEIVGPDAPYYLQNFEDSDYVFDHSLNGFTDDELKELDAWIKTKHKKAGVRGLKWNERVGEGSRRETG